jgi:small subunit ribosomal protein S20
MANTVSAQKRNRVAERRTAVNRMRKSHFRHAVRELRRLIDEKDAKGAAALMPKTTSAIDRAAKSGIIKKNTAARYKSRLNASVKALAA